MANKVGCDLAASTGVHDGKAVVKQILAGAKAVQVASSLYKNGPEHIRTMQDTLKKWMSDHDYSQPRGLSGQDRPGGGEQSRRL